MKVINGIIKGISKSLTKEESKRLAGRLMKLGNSDSIEISETFLNWLMSDREILKGYLISEIKKGSWTSSKIIPFIGGKGGYITEQQKDFLEWAETNRDLIISKRNEAKRGWKTELFKLASHINTQATFYRLLKKFVEN